MAKKTAVEMSFMVREDAEIGLNASGEPDVSSMIPGLFYTTTVMA
jgi:hypothetical protein